ncbi:MAG TPA: TIGR03435 family protein [Bryobacteraceae bacterium]|nr:TIGR03435 family protein [Bryobacteraceae bacterium]
MHHDRDVDGASLAIDIAPGQPLPCGYINGSESGGLEAVGVPVTSLSPILADLLRRPVFDQTGLKGLFNYRLDVAPGPPNSSPQLDDPAYQDSIDAVTSAMEKPGLRIQAAKGTVESVVIDQIERPSAN